jgi:hypothetical protein
MIMELKHRRPIAIVSALNSKTRMKHPSKSPAM